MDLRKEQEQVLIGTLLGDGCIFKDKKALNYRMNFAHSMKQKEYFMMKYNILKDLLRTGPKENSIYDKRTNKIYHEIRVQSKTSSFFTELYTKWYANGKRNLPIDEIMKMEELAFAIWYMDDGYISSSGGSYISLFVYTKEQKMQLIEIINNKFNLNARLHCGNTIYIPAKQTRIMHGKIKKYIPVSMLYKIA